MKMKDWMPSTKAGKFTMFNNVKAKIAGYKDVIGLNDTQVERIIKICDIYLEIYQKTEQIRATAADLTNWQDTILNGEPRGSVAPNAPVFATITLPHDSFIGILDEFRDFVNYIKYNPNYSENIGLDLMIVAEDSGNNNLTESVPELKLGVKNDTQIEIGFKKFSADAIELQYRKAGTETWSLADKATNSPMIFSPQFSTPGQAEKFEFRAIFLVKNQRTGQWSPIYTIIVG